MTRFVLPGGCTRPGRWTWRGRRYARQSPAGAAGAQRQLPNETSLVYLNRLSLLLYYLARAEDAAAGVDFDLAGAPETRPEA